jgi:hypothetical protein
MADGEISMKEYFGSRNSKNNKNESFLRSNSIQTKKQKV